MGSQFVSSNSCNSGVVDLLQGPEPLVIRMQVGTASVIDSCADGERNAFFNLAQQLPSASTEPPNSSGIFLRNLTIPVINHVYLPIIPQKSLTLIPHLWPGIWHGQ